jgi:hypothetical protein
MTLSKRNLLTIVLTVVLSVSLSVLASSLMWNARERGQTDTLRVKKLELVDAQGRVRGSFRLVRLPDGKETPRLTMADFNSEEVLEMGLDERGDGSLSFSNDFWPEGAVVLGHIITVDDGTQSKDKSIEDTSGSWGLEVRSRNGKYIGIGVANSGVPFAPTAATINAQR